MLEEEAPVIKEEAVWVYQKVGQAYIGITNDLERRAAEHGEALAPIAKLPSRLLAKGVEQAAILQRGLENLTNKINNISIHNPNYEKAVEFGKKLLGSIGFK